MRRLDFAELPDIFAFDDITDHPAETAFDVARIARVTVDPQPLHALTTLESGSATFPSPVRASASWPTSCRETRRSRPARTMVVAVTGRNPACGQAEANSIAECPAHFVQADFASVQDCPRVIAEADRLFGRIDLLVNAGALTDRGTIIDILPELLTRCLPGGSTAPFAISGPSRPCRGALHQRLLRLEKGR